MSLRCSLLGHEYGESEIEREREERGDEVVISVTELERCTRCGNARTISENTEVTQRSTPDRPRSDPEPALDAGRSGREPNGPPGGPAPERDTTRETAEPGTSIGPDTNADLVDDAEILEPEPTDEPRSEPEGWPEGDQSEAKTGSQETARDAGTAEWPNVEGDDEGFGASTPDGERPDVEFGGGLTPRSADQGAEVLEGTTARSEGDTDADAEFVRAGASLAPDRTAETDGETEMFCPNCNSSALDKRDSLRAGDICPICHRGYLAERER